MPTLPADSPLQRQIELAWQEIQADPQHRLRIATWLTIYDLLVADLSLPMREFSSRASGHHFPQVTLGLKRYWHLGLQTVTALLPLWERELDRWLPSYVGYEAWRNFPYIFLEKIQYLLEGVPHAEIEARLAPKTPYWAVIEGGTILIRAATSDNLPYPLQMCLLSIASLDEAVWGLAPFTSPFLDAAYDTSFNHDVTHYALEATISAAAPLRDWQQSDMRPVQRYPHIALEFWRGWLFDRVPRAATVDLATLGWEIAEFS